MNNLLRAGFSRLWKNKPFWLCTAAMLALGALGAVMRYYEQGYPDWVSAALHGQPVALAAFTSLFLGTDYSAGTLRNKISVGHRRWAVYLSNLAICTTAAFVLYLVYALPTFVVGTVLLSGRVLAAVYALAKSTLAGLCAMAAFNAIFVLLAMLIPSRSAGAVAAIMLAVLSLSAAAQVEDRLESAEQYRAQGLEYSTNIADVLYDFLPGCQILRANRQNLENFPVMAAYDLGIILAATGAGLVLFGKKDLK